MGTFDDKMAAGTGVTECKLQLVWVGVVVVMVRKQCEMCVIVGCVIHEGVKSVLRVNGRCGGGHQKCRVSKVIPLVYFNCYM